MTDDEAEGQATQRALWALNDIIETARQLKARVEGDGYALSAGDFQNIASTAVRGAVQFSVLEILRLARADRAGEAARTRPFSPGDRSNWKVPG